VSLKGEARLEQFVEIRGHRVHGLVIRALADKHHVHRRTVRQAEDREEGPICRGAPS
jgi:hypothetical protein